MDPEAGCHIFIIIITGPSEAYKCEAERRTPHLKGFVTAFITGSLWAS